QFGISRAAAFEQAVDNLVEFINKDQETVYQRATADFNKAVIAIGLAVVAGVILMIIMRLVFGRVVVKPSRDAGAHFDRIAAGDLTQRIAIRSRNEIGVLYEAMRRMQEGLTRTVSTVRQGV